MSTMIRKTAHFDDCTRVVRCYLDYLMSNRVSEDLRKENPSLSDSDIDLYIKSSNNDYEVCSDVLRHSVGLALGLESGLNFFLWKDLALVCRNRIESELSFARDLSRDKKQGILQMCVHIFNILNEIVVSEV